MYGIDANGAAGKDLGGPFDAMQTIPTRVAQQMPFFQKSYWPSAPTGDATDWRRIDAAFAEEGADVALQLDSATNNTSLVVAFRLPDGEVLLFPGDAQIGSWLSWQQLTWKAAGGTTVTGPDLLKRTVFYKVGHHGSHNATARASGLEEMTSLRVAMIPVDQQEAQKKGWNRMPLPEIITALGVRALDGVIRADAPSNGKLKTKTTNLYHEVEL